MKCQILFSGKNIANVTSSEIAKRVVKHLYNTVFQTFISFVQKGILICYSEPNIFCIIT